MSFFGALLNNKIYSFEQAYPGAKECTSTAMKDAIQDWFRLYFQDQVTDAEDPCQRLPYTIVSKLYRASFAEYEASTSGRNAFVQGLLDQMDLVRKKAMQLTLIGGEAWIKPVPGDSGFTFSVMRRDMVAVLGRNADGQAIDLGSAEVHQQGGKFYTLLERRSLDEQGRLVIQNKLFCSYDGSSIGTLVSLNAVPRYANLMPTAVVGNVGGLGLVDIRLPMENCVDGSQDPVSIYAPAAGLIHNINRNERQLSREFENGESRVFASSDLIKKGKDGVNRLPAGLFIGLDDDPDTTGLTVFSPVLRQQSFLERKKEYLRNLETVIGLKRGLLGEVEAAQRTATEVTSSQGDYALTIQDLQQMWERALRQSLELCGRLGKLYKVSGAVDLDPAKAVAVDWGNGVLYDKEKEWAETLQMVSAGLLKPELALAWKYGEPCETEKDLQKIRDKYMPPLEAMLEE